MSHMRIHYETHRDALGRRAATVVTVDDHNLYERLCCHEASFRGEFYDGQGSVWFLGYARAKYALADCGIEIAPAPACTGKDHPAPGETIACDAPATIQTDNGRTYCTAHNGRGGLRIDHATAIRTAALLFPRQANHGAQQS